MNTTIKPCIKCQKARHRKTGHTNEQCPLEKPSTPSLTPKAMKTEKNNEKERLKNIQKELGEILNRSGYFQASVKNTSNDEPLNGWTRESVNVDSGGTMFGDNQVGPEISIRFEKDNKDGTGQHIDIYYGIEIHQRIEEAEGLDDWEQAEPKDIPGEYMSVVTASVVSELKWINDKYGWETQDSNYEFEYLGALVKDYEGYINEMKGYAVADVQEGPIYDNRSHF